MQSISFAVKKKVVVSWMVFICAFGLSTVSLAGLPSFLNGFQSRSGYSEEDLNGFCDNIKLAISLSAAMSDGANYEEAVRPHIGPDAGPVSMGDFALRLAFIGEALEKLNADPDGWLIYDRCGVR
jgi:hypothetical protein